MSNNEISKERSRQMKKTLSVLLSVTILSISMFIALPTVSGANTSADKLIEKLGFTEQDLIYNENFSTADITSRISVMPTYASNKQAFGVENGKWVIGAKTGTDLTLNGGWTNTSLNDFVVAFEFATNQGWGQSHFYYHSNTGMPDQYAYRFSIVNGAGYKATLVLEKNGDANRKATVNGFDMPLNKEFNIVIASKGNVDSVYIWPKGEEIPSIATLQINTTDDAKGDLYYYTYQDSISIDNIKVYEPSEITASVIEEVASVDLSASDLIYNNKIGVDASVPVEKFDVYNGTSTVEDGKWKTTGEIGTMTGLAGVTELKNFAIGFQFSVNDTKSGWYADFAYHSTTGWANLNNDNRLNAFGQNGKITFVLNGKNGASQYVATNYADGDLINVVMSYIDKTISAYIWKSGEAKPTEPTLKIISEVDTVGDFYFHFSNATFLLDNFLVYENPVFIDNLIQNDKVLIDKNFDIDGDLLFAATDSGITKTADGRFEFNTDGHQMLYSPLLADGEIAKEFSWQFTYIPYETTWNTDRFKFMCQGDTDSDSVYLQILGSGNAPDGNNLQLVRVLNNRAYVLGSATVNIHHLNEYTIRIICENNNISVYWWKAGSNTPDTPILKAASADVVFKKGGFMLEGFHTKFFIDDMKLYNYADGKQLTTYLPELPENVLLANWDFNDKYGKTDFPFSADNTLKYWQNTLQIKTPMKPERKQITTTNIIGDYELSDLSWQFDVREFESWAVDKFIIHSSDGTCQNSIYLLFMGNAAKTLQGGFQGNDSKNSALRLIQVINGKVTVLGTYDEEIARGKGYTIKITSENNNINVYFGSKRSGKISKVISAKADDSLSSGQILIESYNSKMWLDNVKIANCAEGSTTAYDKSLYATVK